MAGSYNHAVLHQDEGDLGQLRSFESFRGMIEHTGEAYEMAEEMYGMIWFLAFGDPAKVEEARKNFQAGLKMSPGVQTEEEHDTYMRRTYPE